MAWQSPSNMGLGNGMGSGGAGDAVQGSQSQGTEYTLQGVMRFLQTEWHRHERERNAWDIERQEMRARIAALEGSARKSDLAQLTSKKYIAMLEGKVKKERQQKMEIIRGFSDQKPAFNHVDTDDKKSKQRPVPNIHNSFLDTSDEDNADLNIDNEGVPNKQGLLTYLGDCQNELAFLMLSSSSPQPPPPARTNAMHNEDAAQFAQSSTQYDESYGQLSQQQLRPHAQEQLDRRSVANTQPVFNHTTASFTTKLPIRSFEPQAAAMVRSKAQHPPNVPQIQGWEAAPPTGQQSSQMDEEDEVEQINHSYDSYGRAVENTEPSKADVKDVETDGWDFNEENERMESESKPATSRPDTVLFPPAIDPPTSPNKLSPLSSQKRKGSMSRRRSVDKFLAEDATTQKSTDGLFKIRFGLRGHLDTIRCVIFTGGGSPGEPEICTAGDEGVIKRWIIPARYEGGGDMQSSVAADLDVSSYFTHRGHTGAVTCLTSYSPSASFASGGRAQGDGWVFSGGEDASIRVWERGRVDPKATLDGHTDAIWAICLLPTTCGTVFGNNTTYGTPDRLILVSGSADGTVKVWSVSAPPTLMSPSAPSATRRGGGRVRGNSMSAGTAYPSSPQPSVASVSTFVYTLIHTIERQSNKASPTCITPLSPSGDNFVVSYADAAVIVYDTRTGEEIVSMASQETFDNTDHTGINAVVATSAGLDGSLSNDNLRGLSEDDTVVVGATGTSAGVQGTIISGHEDRFIRFYDANSGQCTYSMLAHPAAISALALSPDGQELVSAGHDTALRFWSLEKRSCTQEISSHRIMRGEGVCTVVWSQDGRFVVSAGGDGIVKVFAR